MDRRKDIDRIRHEMEELFADLCQVPRLVGARGYRPRLDVYRTDDPPAVTVIAELAGIDPAELDLSFANGALVIAGERRRVAKPGAVYQHIEIDYGRFERRVAIDGRIDPDAIEAVYDRGLLKITLPIASGRPRRAKVAITTKGSA